MNVYAVKMFKKVGKNHISFGDLLYCGSSSEEADLSFNQALSKIISDDTDEYDDVHICVYHNSKLVRYE